MWLLKPVLIGVLALFWILSGIIALARFEMARTILTAHGLPILAGTATLAYLIAGTVWTADLWADPLGPFLKNIPLVLLALVALATAPDR